MTTKRQLRAENEILRQALRESRDTSDALWRALVRAAKESAAERRKLHRLQEERAIRYAVKSVFTERGEDK